MMKLYRNLHALGGTFTLLFITCSLYVPFATAGELSGTEWTVTRGDTLYAIGRAIYPGDTRKQARLRRDIVELNPAVFAGGANNMSVGDVLKLPDYVADVSAPTEVEVAKPAPKPDKVIPNPDLPTKSVKEFGDTGWKVASGDTLYAICRTIYPGEARKQAQLGRDIKKLNPSVFAEGVSRMSVGVLLKLPNYVDPNSIPPGASSPVPTAVPEKVRPEPEPAPVPVKAAPEPEPVPEEIAPEPAKPPVAPAPVAEPQPEKPKVKDEPDSPPSPAKGRPLISLGFSYGGQKLVEVEGGPDINAGTGAQLRLGYEQMYSQGRGYRVSLGLQYYTLFEDSDVIFQNTYLQIAYQHRVNQFIYGIGGILAAGAKLQNEITTKFDPAVGAVVYMENVGSGKLAGWGFSITSLDIKEKETGTSFDASRPELYYNWKF